MADSDKKKKGGRVKSRGQAKPAWLATALPGGADYRRVKGSLHDGLLHTVCQEARCPNQGECWNSGTATFLILGDTCTRGCRFCAVATSPTPPPPVADEAERLAKAVVELKLDYVVITSVDRDDLPDGGAGAFAEALKAVKGRNPKIRTEVLTPDFGGSEREIKTVLDAGPDVFAHNLETVSELTPGIRDRRCSYTRSLEVLRMARYLRPTQITKSGIMLGMGETNEQIHQCMADIRATGAAILTLGQYLQPTTKHLPVKSYPTPDEFRALATAGRKMGFTYVASAPLVRSSYHAAEAWQRAAQKS